MTSNVSNAALVAIIAIVPLIVLMLTSFVKISVVLSLLRNAIGAPDAPSSLVVTGLSLILTFFVMAPVALDMAHAAQALPPLPAGASPGAPTAPSPVSPSPVSPSPVSPSPVSPSPSAGTPSAGAPTAGTPTAGTPTAGAPSAGAPSAGTPSAGAPASSSSSPADAATRSSPQTKPLDLDEELRGLLPATYRPQAAVAARALVPLRRFLARHAATRDRETFVGLASRMGRSVQGDELWVLAPAFMTTELREAFAIAVLVFVPFLVIDLVVGLGLAALGLSATSPQAIALPLKLLLFVSVDGWRLLIEGLLRGYV